MLLLGMSLRILSRGNVFVQISVYYTEYYLSIHFLFQHSQHTFKPLEEVYDTNIVEITEQVAKLQRRHVELISLVQDVVRLNIKIPNSVLKKQCEII